MGVLLVLASPEIITKGTTTPPALPVVPADPIGTVPMGFAIGGLILLLALFLAFQDARGKRRLIPSTNRAVFLDFLGIAAAFNGIMGLAANDPQGGYIAGIIFLGTMVFVGMASAAALKGSGAMYGFLGFLAIGIGAPSLFGWFPNWFLVFVLMLVVAMAIASTQGARVGGD